MATWMLRTAEGTREGLTVYQLQELIRTGLAQGTDEVSQGGAWKRIGELPSLARFLPPPPAGQTSAPAPVERTRQVGRVRLEVGPDGRPLPPPPELVAQLLAMDTDRPQRARQRRVWRLVLVVAAVLLLAELAFLVHAMLRPPPHATAPREE